MCAYSIVCIVKQSESKRKACAFKSPLKTNPWYRSMVGTYRFPYNLVLQGLTTYLLQGSYMDLKITKNLSFPAASLSLLEIVSLLILIPFFDRVVYPGLLRIGVQFTPLRRIGVGMLFAAASVAVAGIIEIERKHAHGKSEQDVFNETVNASTMSVFYQVPQYILQGTSEALVSVTGVFQPL